MKQKTSWKLNYLPAFSLFLVDRRGSASMLASLIIGLIYSIVESTTDIFNNILLSLPQGAFYAENVLSNAIPSHNLNLTNLFNVFYNFGLSLLVLKFLVSAFNTYIMWQSGDPDLDPVQLLLGFCKAMAVAACFRPLYDLLTQVSLDLMSQALSAIAPDSLGFIDTLISILEIGIFNSLTAIILLILTVLLYIQFLTRGIEMLILRIGIPVACIGLLDGNQGVFAPYIKKFFQNALTIITQIVLLRLALVSMSTGHGIYAIAISMMALKTPRFINEFLLFSGGGNAIGTAFHTARLISMGTSLFKKSGI